MADLRGLLKWGLYFSSYWPLYILLVFKHWGFKFALPSTPLIPIQYVGMEIPVLSLLWVILILVSPLIPLLVIYIRKGRQRDPIRINSYDDGSDMLTTYILVYIFPYVVLDYSVLINWLAFLLFFLVVGLVQVRSNRLFINPVFVLLHYRIYEVDDGDRKLLLLTKQQIDRYDDTVSAVKLSKDVYLSL